MEAILEKMIDVYGMKLTVWPHPEDPAHALWVTDPEGRGLALAKADLSGFVSTMEIQMTFDREANWPHFASLDQVLAAVAKLHDYTDSLVLVSNLGRNAAISRIQAWVDAQHGAAVGGLGRG